MCAIRRHWPRFFNVYGPRQDLASPYAAVVPRFIAALRAGRQPTIFGDGLQTRDCVYVGDIVAGLWAAVTLPGVVESVFNVGRGEETSVLDLAQTIGACLGVAVNPVFPPARDGEIRRSCACNRLCRRQLSGAHVTARGPGADGGSLLRSALSPQPSACCWSIARTRSYSATIAATSACNVA
jgi:UDP-glucose 4-epimerase